ncbi:MAG: hypothetical protein IM534_06090 [Chitinophagaceae bacterium]|jgi:hypothetical protein|nr:hypothetical protein [Chitinophagaceae bacterium]MCE2972653.1 hypothetical protein [Sediminibacterium sp.]MCA6483196.1 hypothetical protein [Chitinophagaceae bacterium]MCA6487411.1 hypothetical protein [Chitinophagaceae bacterium]MCA6496076.1 hypothetical protein [Chitinophagaceae bacterium]
MVTLNTFLYFLYWFFSLSDFLGLTIVIVSLIIKYQRDNSLFVKWIFAFYSIFYFLTFLTTLFSLLEKHNNWIYNLIPILITIPLFFFFHRLHNSRILKLFNSGYVLIYLLSAIVFWENVFQTNLNPLFYLLFSFYVLINSVGFLNEELSSMRSQNIFAKIEFWFIACLFFYSTLNVFVWSLFEYSATKVAEGGEFIGPGGLWLFGHNSILFIQSFVFSISLFKTGRTK